MTPRRWWIVDSVMSGHGWISDGPLNPLHQEKSAEVQVCPISELDDALAKLKAANDEIERLKEELAQKQNHANAMKYSFDAKQKQLTLEREIVAMLREALKECRLSAENHTGLNSKSVIMRVYDTSREALAREQEMRK